MQRLSRLYGEWGISVTKSRESGSHFSKVVCADVGGMTGRECREEKD